MSLPRYCLDSNAASVLDVEQRCFIPFDRSNTDFQRVLEWINQGNILGPFTSEVLAELNKEKPADPVQKSGRSLDDEYAPTPTTYF
jgi:L-ribulose-5-phosphate 3-epimerase UlaE